MPHLLTAFASVLVLAACSSGRDAPTAPPVTSVTGTPCGTGGTIQLGVAQAARVDCSNGGTTVTLAADGASYVIVAQFATDQAPNVLVPFTMSSSNATLAATSASASWAAGAFLGATSPSASLGSGGTLVAPAPGSGRGVIPAFAPNRRQQEFDLALLARSQRMAMSRSRGAFPSMSRSAAAANAGSALVATPAQGSIRSFHVLSSFAAGQSQFKTIRAQLAYVGNNILLYIDSLAPSNGFTPDELTNFGGYVDQALYPIDTATFGPPSDFDQNGHVIMLMSPVVNADTPATTCRTTGYIAGFFDSGDFNSAQDPNSNQGEIFYSIVPDPSGMFSCPHTVTSLGLTLPSTFLHELQHLINYSQHVVVGGGQAGSQWLDEGMSIVAEELGSRYFEQKCPPPSCRSNPSQLFPDSAQGFVQSFLFDSYEYALNPDTASITLNLDSGNGFAWRGGAWLLAHWLGDQQGSSVYGKLERGPSNGIADIEQATGQGFPALFANFGLALYTDSLPGFPRTFASAVNRFTTRNPKQLWARLFTTSASAEVPRQDPLQLNLISADTSAHAMVPGTMSFFRLDGPVGKPTVTIRFAARGGGAFSSTLRPQIAIFRLPNSLGIR